MKKALNIILIIFVLLLATSCSNAKMTSDYFDVTTVSGNTVLPDFSVYMQSWDDATAPIIRANIKDRTIKYSNEKYYLAQKSLVTETDLEWLLKTSHTKNNEDLLMKFGDVIDICYYNQKRIAIMDDWSINGTWNIFINDNLHSVNKNDKNEICVDYNFTEDRLIINSNKNVYILDLKTLTTVVSSNITIKDFGITNEQYLNDKFYEVDQIKTNIDKFGSVQRLICYTMSEQLIQNPETTILLQLQNEKYVLHQTDIIVAVFNYESNFYTVSYKDRELFVSKYMNDCTFIDTYPIQLPYEVEKLANYQLDMNFAIIAGNIVGHIPTTKFNEEIIISIDINEFKIANVSNIIAKKDMSIYKIQF